MFQNKGLPLHSLLRNDVHNSGCETKCEKSCEKVCGNEKVAVTLQNFPPTKTAKVTEDIEIFAIDKEVVQESLILIAKSYRDLSQFLETYISQVVPSQRLHSFASDSVLTEQNK